MGGLYRIFTRILPIITLICFISLGILHMFGENNQNLTYITTEYYDKETGNLYINPTEQEKQNSNKLYTFDLVEYTSNIDQNILKRSVSKTFNIQAYENIIDAFQDIWQDGYQLGDLIKSIFYGVIMVLDTGILTINIFLIPIRIIAGILLTGMSIIGININNGTIIIPFLKIITDNLVIPLISPPYSNEQVETMLGSSYRLLDDPQRKYYEKFTTVIAGQLHNSYTDFDIDVTFRRHNWPSYIHGAYGGIKTSYTIENGIWHFKIWYKGNIGVNEIQVYDNGWLVEEEYRIIYFQNWSNVDDLDSTEKKQLILFLDTNARPYTPPEENEAQLINTYIYLSNDNKKYIFA